MSLYHSSFEVIVVRKKRKKEGRTKQMEERQTTERRLTKYELVVQLARQIEDRQTDRVGKIQNLSLYRKHHKLSLKA